MGYALIGPAARRRAVEIVAARTGGEVWEWAPGQFVVRPKGFSAPSPLRSSPAAPSSVDPATLPGVLPFPGFPSVIPEKKDLAPVAPTVPMSTNSVGNRNEPLLTFLSDAEIPQIETDARTAPGPLGRGPGEKAGESRREKKQRKAPVQTPRQKAISEGRAEIRAEREQVALEKAHAKGRKLGANDPLFPSPRKKTRPKTPRRKKPRTTAPPDVRQPLRRLLPPSVIAL